MKIVIDWAGYVGFFKSARLSVGSTDVYTEVNPVTQGYLKKEINPFNKTGLNKAVERNLPIGHATPFTSMPKTARTIYPLSREAGHTKNVNFCLVVSDIKEEPPYKYYFERKKTAKNMQPEKREKKYNTL